MSSFKVLRIEQILLEEINSLIVLKKIKDPRVSSRASVMYVKVSKDTTAATVFISGYMSDEKLQTIVDGLNHARGFIQKRIAEKYAFKHTPKLLFKQTQALQHAESVIEIMRQNSKKHGIDNSQSVTQAEDDAAVHE